MPSFRAFKKIVIPSRSYRFARFLEQFISPTPSRTHALNLIGRFINPGISRRGISGFLNEFINPRVRRYGVWGLISQFFSPEAPQQIIIENPDGTTTYKPWRIITHFIANPVWRLDQSRDIIRPRERNATLLQRIISGINEFVNARTDFSRFFKSTTIVETPSEAFMEALEALVFRSRQNIETLAEQLYEGELTPQQYQARMITQIRRLNLAAGLLGVRGLGNITPDAMEIINTRVAEEVARLNKFVQDSFGVNFTKSLSDVGLSRAQFINYSRGFASAGRGTATVAQQELMQNLYGAGIEAGGILYMRRVLSPGAAHCGDCEAWADLSWVSVNDGGVPYPTQACICGNNCKCSIEFALSSSYDSLPEDIAY